MSDRHHILIIEDDLEAGEDLADLLETFGYASQIVTNLEEAKPSIASGRFCLILLDLQIKLRPDDSKPLVEAGLSALDYARSEHPARNEDDKHLLQVLVMSGHAKETQDVVRSMQSGANDFVRKPIGEDPIPLRDKIRQALRHSGRLGRHERCGEIGERARRRAPRGDAEGEKDPASLSLEVTGDTTGTRSEVMVGGKRALLTTASLLVLLRLISARDQGGEGWVDRLEVARGDHGHKQFSRLKKELGGLKVCENNKDRGYRLDRTVAVRVDWTRLASHGNERVKALAEQALSRRST